MPKTGLTNPFHSGEIEAQALAGAGDVAQWAAGFIRDYLPEQHRDFHTSLPFLVIAGGDMQGRTWVTLTEGPDGFVTSPDPRRIDLRVSPDSEDPLARAFASGTEIGVLGIELATRRRNRFNGYLHPEGQGYRIDIRQSFGNCPQYIHERAWQRLTNSTPAKARRSQRLDNRQIDWIKTADTLFIGSGQMGDSNPAARGYDASHRGGAPGFVDVADNRHLRIPDYPGNNFFNTIGNLLADSRIGLVFADFETGGLLHVSGRARIDWERQGPDALRWIEVEIDAVVERPAALTLRWEKQNHLSRQLKLIRREAESGLITSFYFAAADGQKLHPFKAGQHLPIEVQIPGQAGISKRSYSLSGAPGEKGHYRLSIKREDKGLVSRFLHDKIQPGTLIEARNPSGDFAVPCSNCPLVLVSAGVGLTPMLAMLHATAGQDRPVTYVHSARHGGDHALRAEVKELVAQYDNLKAQIFYSRPRWGDVLGRDYDVSGRITADSLLALNAGPQAHYMMCGPAPFLAELRHGLEARSVSADHIHFETFGPGS